MENRLEALHDAIVVKKIDIVEEQTSRILRPEIHKERGDLYEVISSGPGRYFGNLFVENQLKPGDKVYLPAMGFTKIVLNKEDYFVISEHEIGVKLND